MLLLHNACAVSKLDTGHTKLGGLPWACLEYSAEGLLTSDTLACPRTLALPLVLLFPGTEVLDVDLRLWGTDLNEEMGKVA